MENEHRYLRRIVIEARNQNPRSPLLTTKPEHEFEFYHSDLLIRPPRPRIFSVEEINEDDWKISWETDYRDDFKKVASVVGKDKAGDVLRALGRPVPEKWDRG
ncbi:hypothetical protein [Amycolatopsis sp. NPDC003731]